MEVLNFNHVKKEDNEAKEFLITNNTFSSSLTVEIHTSTDIENEKLSMPSSENSTSSTSYDREKGTSSTQDNIIFKPNTVPKVLDLIKILPQFHFGQLTKHNVYQLKKLNLATLPVRYVDSFYDSLHYYSEFSRLAYISDILVGAICCRITVDSNIKRLYIMTINVLKPYRNYGIASYLLSYILNLASKTDSIKSAYLHVWTENPTAIHFYINRGFIMGEKIINYYPEMVPSDGYEVYCDFPYKDPLNIPLHTLVDQTDPTMYTTDV